MNHLLPNTWMEPWESKDTYLETHYRLQREEAITMLRYGIKKFKESPNMMDDDEACIYTKVFVKGYLMTRLGPMCRVQFSTGRSGKKIRWIQTRRLTVGTLVALSTAQDCFQTICMPAIISDHRVEGGLDQNPPVIHLQWTNLDDAVMDPNQELVMVEDRFGYFEAVRHSMVGLQHVAETHTPLDKYLVQAHKVDLPAKYVEENPTMNVSSLVDHSSSTDERVPREELAEVIESLKRYSVLDGFDNELSKYTSLDKSQLDAVYRILTRELAIVQGPPGTGKTFTSVQALQILLESQDRGSNVVVVAAQTNHAVDQILIQLIKLGFHVVRLGGRTQNEDIKRYSMYNLRHRAHSRVSRRVDKDYRIFDSARQRNIENIEKVITDVFPEHLINPENLYTAGIISESQLQSLQTDGTWISATALPDGPEGPLAEWLGVQLMEVKVRDEKDPDFEAVESDDNLDADEQDYDMELDDCIIAEDENSGRVEGKFLPIRHAWTGANPRNYSETDLQVRRELQKPNLWDVDTKYRGAIYQYWQKKLLSLHDQSFRRLLEDNAGIAKNLKANRWYRDTQCIRSAQVEIIGCTTTGLCKYRGLLAALRPRTMLIEEAAETKEANILSALYGSLQQLILVGDHQQLVPQCSTPGLADAPYYMRVSMFERLVKLNMPFTMLNMQRRMAPLLREILNPFYPSLQDHPVVRQKDARPPVPGMSVDSFFFHHTWAEGMDENWSRYNVLEAEMVVRFIDYLMMNGVPASQITVLTFYRGQKKKILAQFKHKLKHWAPFTNVYTVDSYQGEENDIVVLSLVRSHGPNGPHQAGFLQDENRGVVSISRARRGFYIFGNMINLAHASNKSRSMWGRVQEVFRRHGHFGGDTRLPVTCQTHGKTTWMSHPEDWVNCHGGCDQACSGTLTCGHRCGRRCHWIPHEKLICQEPCERRLSCSHQCQRICGDNCFCNCAGFASVCRSSELASVGIAFSQGGVELRNGPSRLAPFVSQSQPRMGMKAGGENGRQRAVQGGQRGQRTNGDRRGLGCSGSGAGRRQPGQSVDNDQNHRWGNFDIKNDDERERKEVQTREKERAQCSGEPNPVTIRDTFLPVTLNHRGERQVGDRVILERGSTPSSEESHDLLDFNDTVETTTLTLRSIDLIGDRADRDILVDEAIGTSDDDAAGPPVGPSGSHDVQDRRSPRAYGAVPLVSQPFPRPVEQSPSHTLTPDDAFMVCQVDRPEWELGCATDMTSIIEGYAGDEEKKEEEEDGEGEQRAPYDDNERGGRNDLINF
ncbi:P-loop containing nucleoside triphosphate hydrolase protein [Durotheca rogersii]|uniref:P-loop containing nucleoside triphosphate hydrolase protein n=1 Tax=Durotheca rogersii TaxID=419775 RepID=UPI002220C59C|nr:P-loop containing nucleoside triphosphate hydrolase protein [Durotheca rogersii]KAI5860952.1 P-loop containing nucleoside triphosphate hydrolase protein [Durotheca rogersii]